ncbi:hypothetical protein C8R46DRAFT_1219019 [Mycena filopes]|nr:hypothetical protein C8R46DRAFT_1219019 [Mycena filopes]
MNLSMLLKITSPTVWALAVVGLLLSISPAVWAFKLDPAIAKQRAVVIGRRLEMVLFDICNHLEDAVNLLLSPIELVAGVDRGLYLNMPVGLEIIHAHVEHITGIWGLVEAIGYPGGNIFVPVEERILLSRANPLPVPVGDLASKRMLRLMTEFLGRGSTLDEDLVYNLLLPCLTELQAGSGETLRNETLDSLSKLSTPPPTEPASKRQAPHVALDRKLDRTITSLASKAKAHHHQIMGAVESILPLAESSVQVGSRLLTGIESEMQRAGEFLQCTPKTDSRTLSDLLEMSSSRSAQFTAYSNFLQSEAKAMRTLLESVSIIRDNLKELQRYCVWSKVSNNS